MQIAIIERRLKREHSLPDDFHFYKWNCYPHHEPTIAVEFYGGRCPLLKSGKRKGKPNYRKLQDKQTFVVSVETGQRWEQEYIAETGNCVKCLGTGERVVSASVTRGIEYAPCRNCRGTGRAKQEADQCQ